MSAIKNYIDDGRDVVFLETCQCAASTAECLHDEDRCQRFAFQTFWVTTEHTDEVDPPVRLQEGGEVLGGDTDGATMLVMPYVVTAYAPQLDTDGPHHETMATTRPPEASLPCRALRRQNP
jgi:hypothetical protein